MKVYAASIEDFTELQGIDLLSNTRRSHLENLNILEDKQRCLVAGLLLRYALGEISRDIQQGENGKPFIPEGPCFNLSHSGDYVVLTTSEHEIGVDIELIAAYKDKLARRCCTIEEYDWLQSQSPETFYQLWTGKESIMKATGLGFSLPPGSFSVLPVSDGNHLINDKRWYMKWLNILDGYAFCVSCSFDEPVDVYMLSIEELLR